MKVLGLDHLVLRVADVEAVLAWYCDVLGLEPLRVEQWRAGKVPFPSVRVDAGTIIDLVTGEPPEGDGNLDHFCLVVDAATVEEVVAGRIPVEVGPVGRFGARGEATSVYVRDPAGTVVELRAYPD